MLNVSVEGMIRPPSAALCFFVSGLWRWLVIGVAHATALLQAFLSNTLRVNQIVSGIGINILALGATTLAYREIFGAP